MVFGWLRRLFARGGEEDFIKRIERGDLKYIMEVGVPSDEAPRLPSVKTWKKPFIAEGFVLGSVLLRDPQALMYILLSAEVVDVVRVRGDGDYVLSQVARTSLGYKTPIYAFGVAGQGEIRLLAYKGMVTGLWWGPKRGSPLAGIDAYKIVSSETFEPFTFSVSRIKPRLMEWKNDVFSVYVKGLDRQHRYLINTLNTLYHAVVSGSPEKVVEAVLDRMLRYTKFHFKSEEILMERYDYPEEKLLRHVREHNSFVTAVTEFRERYERGEDRLTVDVFKFLAQWVQNHIAGTDRDYGLYFKKIGVANL